MFFNQSPVEVRSYRICDRGIDAENAVVLLESISSYLDCGAALGFAVHWDCRFDLPEDDARCCIGPF